MTKPAKAGTEATQRFTAVLEQPDAAGTTTFVRIPPAVMTSFAPRRRVPVVVTLNAHTWRTTIAPYGTDYYIPVRAEIRAAAGAAAGDSVSVELRRDDEPRQVGLPADLAAALDEHGARLAFAAFSFSHQSEYVKWIEAAKRPATRSTRIDKTVANVREKRPLK